EDLAEGFFIAPGGYLRTEYGIPSTRYRCLNHRALPARVSHGLRRHCLQELLLRFGASLMTFEASIDHRLQRHRFQVEPFRTRCSSVVSWSTKTIPRGGEPGRRAACTVRL